MVINMEQQLSKQTINKEGKNKQIINWYDADL